MAKIPINTAIPNALAVGFGMAAGNIAMRALGDSPWPLALIAGAIAAAVVALAAYHLALLVINRRDQ
jgi:hypothetical protein